VRAAGEGFLIGAFLMAISLPGILMVAGDGERPMVRREEPARPERLTAMPETTLPAIRKLKRAFEENFGLRKQLLRWHGLLMVKGLGVSGSVMTVVGKEGWLFLAREVAARGETNFLSDYRGTRPFTAPELAGWTRALEERRQWLAERGIRYLFVVAPNKESIYPEFLPATITRVSPRTRLDDLVAAARQNPRLAVVDLRPALREAKRHGRVYHRTDSHWNAMGAYAADGEIARSLARELPAVQPLPLSDFEVSVVRRPGGDLARFLGLQELLDEESVRFRLRRARPLRGLPGGLDVEGRDVDFPQQTVIECDDAPLPRAVVAVDSFGASLLPFLARHFRRTLVLPNTVVNLDRAAVEREQPAVFIHLMVERRLLSYPRPLSEEPESGSEPPGPVQPPSSPRASPSTGVSGRGGKTVSSAQRKPGSTSSPSSSPVP
jgi:hypothetical protein